MIKVFLAEDEIVIRNGIKNSIEWEKEGYQFVGEAGDGELAYPMILKTKPDILITDIRMPFMDGLELSRLVRQDLPDIKILILSGYDEFDYAKEAIKLRVAEYLLKPISSAKLLEVLKESAASIYQEREERELLKRYEEDMRENRQHEKDEFLTRILTHNISVTEILEQGRQLGLDLSAGVYNTMLFKIAGFSGDRELTEVFTKIENLLDGHENVYYFRRGAEGWALLCLAEDEAQLEEKLLKLTEDMEAIMAACPARKEYFGAFGHPVSRLGALKESMDEAERVFAYRYLKEWNQIIGSSDLEERISDNKELNLSSLKVDKLDRKIVEQFLKTGLKGEVTHFIKEYLESLGENNIQSLLFRQYVTMDIYLAAVGILEELGYESDELVKQCGDFKDMETVFQNAEQTKEYLKNVLETTIDLREAVSKQKYSQLLKEAKNYIEGNLVIAVILLNTAAASVNLSPNHFSTIFSQEMGKTFIEFLTDVRMGRAKELLRSSAMKTAEIAYAVGYKDSHYFSYLFKKTQKCTPREFRSQV